MENLILKEQRCKFDEAVIAKLGEPVTETDFPDEDLTPTYDAYVNDIADRTPNAPEEELEPTPEAGDKYVNADVMLPRGGNLSRGQVIE